MLPAFASFITHRFPWLKKAVTKARRPGAATDPFRSTLDLTFDSLKRRIIGLRLNPMAHLTDLNELQSVVGRYAGQFNLVKAASPLAGAGVFKLLSKNKMANLALVGSGIWFAVNEISTPMLRLVQDQFGFLGSLFGGIR
jgi:hypothetical protein